MDQINKTASKVRSSHEKKESLFGTKPVLTEKSLSKPSTPAVTEQGNSIKGSSVGEKSVGLSNKDDNGDHSDSDSVIDKNKNKRADQLAVEKFELEKCTTIRFISLTGETMDKLLTKRIVSYSELQREIARLNPKMNKMYVIQNSFGVRITSDYFRNEGDTALIRVKEIGLKPDPFMMKKLGIKWEAESYHEVRASQSVYESTANDLQDDFSDMMSVNSYQAGFNEDEEDGF